MLRHLLPCALLMIAAPAFAQPFAPDKQPDASQDLTPAQRVAQFHHDEINLLALRTDARALLSAALMARADAGDATRPRALQTPALLARAQKFDPDNTLTWWVSAALECQKAATPCPDDATLQQLERLDSANGATWLWALHRAQLTGNDASARAALTSAAQSARFDDYFGTLVASINEAAGILPVGEDILAASGQRDAGPAGFKLTYAAGLAARLPQPYLEALSKGCDGADGDAALAADCIAIAQKIADSGSMGTRAFGLRLLLQLSPPGAARDAAASRARTLAWRNQKIGGLAARLTGDSRITAAYLQALGRRGNELDAVDAVLQLSGVTLEPPADWQAPESPGEPAGS